MRRNILLMAFCLFAVTFTHAQKKWEDLSDEQKLAKLKTFRAENQKYLKDTLKLTQTQIGDLDNLNLCFLSTLDRIDRYAKSEEAKEEYANALWEVRWAQVDAIMGKQKHEKYAAYIKRKIMQAAEKRQI